MPVKINKLPSLDILQHNIEYNPDTGVMIAKTGGKAGWKIGHPVGTFDRGYIRIRISGKYYAAHRIAWAMCNGECAEDIQIDHIDGNRSNNKIDNLRLATHGQNCQNIKTPKHNTSGYKGVHWATRYKKWKAQIRLHGKRISLGLFTSKEEAYLAYCSAAKKLHGAFSNV